MNGLIGLADFKGLQLSHLRHFVPLLRTFIHLAQVNPGTSPFHCHAVSSASDWFQHWRQLAAMFDYSGSRLRVIRNVSRKAVTDCLQAPFICEVIEKLLSLLRFILARKTSATGGFIGPIKYEQPNPRA